MNKQAAIPTALLQRLAGSGVMPTLARGAMGAAAGGLHGYYVTPKILDFEDSPGARHSAAWIDALLGGVLGGMYRGQSMAGQGGKILTGLKWYAGGQALPALQATMEKQRDASRALAESGKLTSIPYNVQQFAQSGIGKGLAGGAAAAGMGGLLTGLLRRRNEEEERRNTGRASMVSGDMLKFLLPALAAGGIIGSLKGQPQ